MKEEDKPIDPECRRRISPSKQEKWTQLSFQRDNMSCYICVVSKPAN